MGFPSRNQTGWRCQILFSASGSFDEIAVASRPQISCSAADRPALYSFVPSAVISHLPLALSRFGGLAVKFLVVCLGLFFGLADDLVLVMRRRIDGVKL